MEQLDAKDRAAMLKIETKRQHGLAEIASELTGDLYQFYVKLHIIEIACMVRL